MASILITGANGFVGPYLVAALQEDFTDNLVIHACYFGEPPKTDTGSNVQWHKLNIADRNDVDDLLQKTTPDYLVHLAAISHVPTASSSAELTWQINVMGSLYLFEAVRKFAKDCRIVFASSSEVYGSSFKEFSTVDENACLHPLNAYATTKAAIDLLAAQLAGEGVKIIRLRPFNHIGPGQMDNFVVPAFASQIARIESGVQDPVIKVGNLSAIRDFLDVRDVVRVYSLVLQRFDKLPNGSVYNIASGHGYKIETLLDKLCAQSLVDVKIEQDSSRMRPIEIPRAVGDARQIQNALGWLPVHSIDQTLKNVLDEWRAKY